MDPGTARIWHQTVTEPVPIRHRRHGTGRLGAVREHLVSEWMALAEAARVLGQPESRLRQLLREGRLLAFRRGDPPVLAIPASFIRGGELLKGLGGTITVLHDAGYGPDEALEWLFSDDPVLETRPIEALDAGRVREVHRRAQVAGF